MKVVTDSQLNPETYYKLSSFNSKGEYITEKSVHNFEITTENIDKNWGKEAERNIKNLLTKTDIQERIPNNQQSQLIINNLLKRI